MKGRLIIQQRRIEIMQQRKLIASAAALSSLVSSFSPVNVSAFQQQPFSTHPIHRSFDSRQYEPARPSILSPTTSATSPYTLTSYRYAYKNEKRQTQTRLFGTNDKSFFGKVGDTVRSMLPFGSKKGELTKKEQAKQDVSSSIDTVLKDAPLGVRMMGKLIKPLVSSVAGNIAQAMEEQSRQMSDLLGDARGLIVQDSRALDNLGEPIEMGSPFSQSSSTMSVNGKTRSSIQASFEVRGSRGSGVATMTATDGQIDQLSLNVNGRNLSIDTSPSSSSWSSASVASEGGSSRGIGQNSRKNDDIIDAEFVDKKVTK